MKKTNQLTTTFIIALFLIAGFAFGSFGQESEKKEKKVIEIVDEVNGIEKRATATFENGEWSYEGNLEMIERLKTQIKEQKDGDGHFTIHSGAGETRVVKHKVFDSDGEDHNIKVEVIMDEGDSHQNMMFVDDEGNVTQINTDGGDGDYVWVQDSQEEGGGEKIVVISGGHEVDSENMENIKVLIHDGASKEEIMRELDIDADSENIFLTIDKTIEVELENGEESKSEKIIIIVKRFKLAEVEESEIPKTLKKGFTINENGDLKETRFYPNPSNGEFRVQAKVDSEAPIDILITDMDGKKVVSETIKGHGGNLDYNINIRDRSPGMYLVRISQNSEGVVKKIVVN